MVNTEFTLGTGQNTAIIANGIVSDPSDTNTITRGETATYTFLNALKQLKINSGDTYVVAAGETERYDLVTVDGTLEINGTLECDKLDNNGTVTGGGTLKVNEKFAFELADVEQYSTYAGKYSVTETLGSKQTYNELLPDTADINSLLVSVEPSGDLEAKTINGYWGLIENITDARNRPLTNKQIEMSIQILAPRDEYSDRTAVQTDLEVNL